MIIEIEKELLLTKLQLATRFTSDRLSTSTALQGVLINIQKNQVSIFSTNLTTYFTTSLSIQAEEELICIIEPRKIIEFLQLLPPGMVKLNFQQRILTISLGKTKGNFPTLLSQDFPLPPDLSEFEKKLESNLLTEKLPLVMFAASGDDARPVLTGVNFVATNNEMLFVATDGFRLSLLKQTTAGAFPSMIIPAEFLQEVKRNIAAQKEVTFAYSETEKIVCFRVGVDKFYSRLIEGEFPPFEKVIPAEKKTTVTIEKAEFLRNIKLISVFARDYSNVVICEFGNNEVLIRPKKEGNDENNSTVEAVIEGEAQKTAFNYKYLLDLLNSVNSKEVIIEILRSDAPIVFKLKEQPEFLHIIMPVRIQE